MKEQHLSKTPFLTLVYISKCNINLPGYFGNSKKRFLWTGLVYTQHWKPSRMIISYFEFPNRCHRLVFKATATFPPTHRSLCHKTTHKLTSTPCCIVLVKYLSQCFLIGVPITTITPDFMPQPLHRFCFWLNRQALRGHIEILSGAYFEFSKHFYIQVPK